LPLTIGARSWLTFTYSWVANIACVLAARDARCDGMQVETVLTIHCEMLELPSLQGKADLVVMHPLPLVYYALKFYYHESMIVYLFSIAAEVDSMWNSVALEHVFRKVTRGARCWRTLFSPFTLFTSCYLLTLATTLSLLLLRVYKFFLISFRRWFNQQPFKITSLILPSVNRTTKR
jgi:hypothetical protein